jgi:RNA polymerase sigma factor (sigma-70 family)
MGLFIRGNTANFKDLELIERYRETDDKFFVGELFKRYSHLVFGVCLGYFRDRDVSKDAVMCIFEKLFDALKKHEVQHFPTWLGFVSRNYCISEIRKRKTRTGREAEHANELLDERCEDQLPGEVAEVSQESQIGNLEQALLELKDEQRICLDLFYLKDKSYKDISALTGFSEKEVKSFIQNGKRNLKIQLANNSHDHIPA